MHTVGAPGASATTSTSTSASGHRDAHDTKGRVCRRAEYIGHRDALECDSK